MREIQTLVSIALFVTTSSAVAQIQLLPLGPVEPGALRALQRAVDQRFMAAAEILPAQELPEGAFDSGRGQYNSSTILDRLFGHRPESSRVRALAVTDVDLYAEGLNFVFGQADYSQGVAIISLARLAEEFYGRRRNQARLRLRAVKEAIHELGHLDGLGHCPNPGCVMYFSNSLADTDRKSSDFCRSCGLTIRRLRRLHR